MKAISIPHKIFLSEWTPALYLMALFLFQTSFIANIHNMTPIILSVSLVMLFCSLAVLYKAVDLRWSAIDLCFCLYVISILPSLFVNLSMGSLSRYLLIVLTYLVARLFKARGKEHIYIVVIAICFVSLFPGNDAEWPHAWYSPLWPARAIHRSSLLFGLFILFVLEKDRWWFYPLFIFVFICSWSRLSLLICFGPMSYRILCSLFDKKVLSLKIKPYLYLFVLILALAIFTLIVFVPVELLMKDWAQYIMGDRKVSAFQRALIGSLSVFIVFTTLVYTFFSSKVRYFIIFITGFFYLLSFYQYFGSYSFQEASGLRLYFNPSQRGKLIRMAWSKISVNPFGIGLGNDKAFYANRLKKRSIPNAPSSYIRSSHNFFTTIMLEQGWLAGLFYIILIGVLFGKGNAQQRATILFGHFYFSFNPGDMLKPVALPFTIILLYFMLEKKMVAVKQ